MWCKNKKNGTGGSAFFHFSWLSADRSGLYRGAVIHGAVMLIPLANARASYEALMQAFKVTATGGCECFDEAGPSGN